MVEYLLFMGLSALFTMILTVLYINGIMKELCLSVGMLTVSCFLGGIGSCVAIFGKHESRPVMVWRIPENYTYDPYKNIPDEGFTEEQEFTILTISNENKEE